MTRSRIIIHAIGSAGDVHPFLGIGTALAQRGHDVYVVTNPFYKDLVIDQGLGFRPLGTEEEFHRIKNDPDLWHPRRAFPAIVKHVVNPSHSAIYEISRELHLPGNTILVSSSLAFASRTAAELLNAPMATVHLAPSLFASEYRQPSIHGMPFGNSAPRFLKRLQWSIAAKVVDHFVLPGLNRFRKSHGLPPAKKILTEWWHSPDRVIALFPSWFAPMQPDWPAQTIQTGFPLFDAKSSVKIPTELQEFLAEGSPPVLFTPGSAMAQAKGFFIEAAKAVEMMGCRALFLTGFRENLPTTLPAGTAYFPYIPFSSVLPHCAALVYHGGVGTCAQALQAGIPHLVQPMAHDQLDTLSRVQDLGVGLGIHPAKFKADTIAATLHHLIGNPSFRNNAREIATCFTPNRWIDQTCSAIEGLSLH